MSELSVLPLSAWLNTYKGIGIIAGPCSAETPEQLATTFKALNALDVGAIRVGVWKPRTRPGSFEGKGEEALTWIKDLKSIIHKPIATEVASPQHVELALKYGIDILWIGARTSVNPFNVQDLADALKGVDIPVMIKNPVNPDIALWIGAIERIYGAGIRKIAAIHRGFSFFQKSEYRNPPTWQIPLELKRLYPNLPLINDPSHITGKRALVASVAQKALDLNYDGLMIETHYQPENAWSDADQQITPQQLKELIENLQIRQKTTNNTFFNNQLEILRKQIDSLDEELLGVLASRMRVVEQIGLYKNDNNISVFQLERWNEIFQTRPLWAEKMQLNKELIEGVFQLIHLESIKKQTEIAKKNNTENYAEKI